MKKLLYGSTALVAAGLLSGAAVAQEEAISGSLSGWWVGQFAIIDQDDGLLEGAPNRRDHEFQRFGTISLSGNTTLDNGLQVGISFDWNTETVGAEVSRDGFVWMEFGGFRAELGSTQGAANKMGYAAPTPSMFAWGFNSPVFSNVTTPGANAAGGPSERVNLSGGNEKLTLFTPRFGGIQLGASYTPDGTKDPTAVFSGPPTDNDAGQQSEIIDIGANFVTSLDEVDLNIGAGWTEGDLELAAAGADDAEQWAIGTSISYMSWTFGAALKNNNLATSAASTDRNDWNVGVKYTTGPWGAGVQYQESTVELGAGAGEDTASRLELGGQYEVGPGIAFQLGVQYVDFESGGSVVADENSASAIYLGTSIFF